MKFKITSIDTVKDTHLLYVDVEFIDDSDQVVHYNDFVMQISPVQRRYVGPELKEDEEPDLKNYEETPVDIEAVIVGNITAYMRRHSNFSRFKPDNRDPDIEKDNTDPLGLKEAVRDKDLIGIIKDITGATAEQVVIE